MNLQQFKKKARLIRKSSRYSVYDLHLNKLVTSLTILHPKKETKGHSHDAEEVYLFIEGEGEIKLDKRKRKVKAGDILPIKKGVFHKVFNPHKEKFVFYSVFQKYPGRGKKC